MDVVYVCLGVILGIIMSKMEEHFCKNGDIREIERLVHEKENVNE